LEFVTETIVAAKGAANCVKLNQLDASQEPVVPVVNEFSNVSHEELLDMPPDRDIELVIDWMPGTAPIYKSLYRMATP
jgi:hypothetical protein